MDHTFKPGTTSTLKYFKTSTSLAFGVLSKAKVHEFSTYFFLYVTFVSGLIFTSVRKTDTKTNGTKFNVQK